MGINSYAFGFLLKSTFGNVDNPFGAINDSYGARNGTDGVGSTSGSDMPICIVSSEDRMCQASDSDFQFWFHGVFSLIVNLGAILASILFIPVLGYLFRIERKNSRSAAVLLSEFYLLLMILLVCGSVHGFIETWEWSLPHISYAAKIQHHEIRLYQDFFREVNDTTFVYSLVFMTILRHRTTQKGQAFGLPRLFAVIAGIVLFSVFYILPSLFTKVPGIGCFDPCLNRTVFKLVKTDLRKTNKYYIIIYKTNLTLIISFLIPFSLLITFNAKIIMAMKRANLVKEKLQTKNKGKELQNKVYRICMWVTIMFLLNRLPYFISILIRYVNELSGNKEMERTEQFKSYSRFCIFLICVHPVMTMMALICPSHILRKSFRNFYQFDAARAESMRRSGLLMARLRTTRKTKNSQEAQKDEESTNFTSEN